MMSKERTIQIRELAQSVGAKVDVKKKLVSSRYLAKEYNIPLFTYDEMAEKQVALYSDFMKSFAFNLVDDGVRTIFYQKGIPDYILLHEVAHCLLKHEGDTPEHEEEANLLLSYLYLLPDSPLTLVRKRKKGLHIFFIVSTCLILFLSGFAIARLDFPFQQTYTHTPIEVTTTVYDTPTGKRYHISKTCAGVNAIKTTVEQAKANGKTPCQVCIN